MTVLKQYKGSGTVTDPANWDTIFVGATGPAGPTGANSTVPGPQGPTGPTGPPPPVVSLTRAAWLALSPPNPNTVYIITDEGGVMLSGTTAPGGSLGFNGDFYLNSTTWQIYGPKTTGGWGTGTSIIGPAGSGGGGSGVTIQEDGTPLSGTFTTLNFANGLDPSGAAPNGTITVDLGEYSGTNLPNAKVQGLGALATLGTVGTTQITNDAVTYAKLQNISTNNRVLGLVTGAPADAIELTGTQVTAMLDVATTSVKGLAPTLSNVATQFLNGVGGYTVPAGTGVPTTRTLTGTAPIQIGGVNTPVDLSVDRTVTISDFTTTARGAVPLVPGGASTGLFLMDDGTWKAPPTSIGVSGVFPFTYNTSTLESITGSQMRGNNATFSSSTKLWISETTVDGLDVTIGLGRIKAGFQVYVQDYTSSARYALFSVTADSIDKGNYWEITVAPVSFLGTIPGGKVALQSLSSAQSSTLFSTTTTAPGLTPGANNAGATAYLNGIGTWTVPAGGGGSVPYTAPTTSVAAIVGFLEGTTNGTNRVNLTGPANITTDYTVTLPATADTLVGKATTDTLTNKTFDTAGTGNSFSINGVTATANTGTGAVARATSPTFVTPALGTPSAGVLTSCSGLPTGGVSVSATARILGRQTAGAGVAEELTAANVITVLGLTGAATMTLPVALANGGTGQTTKGPAFNALSPMTTAGDVIVGGASGAGSRLAVGSNTQVFTVVAGAPAWAAAPLSMVQQTTAPADTTVLWADTSQVGIEENARYLSNVTGTTYTLVLADRGKLILCSNAAPQTVTVPTNATAAFVIGTQLDLVQMGVGLLTIAAAGGVTINATPSLAFRAQYSGASLIKTATDSWLLMGDLQ